MIEELNALWIESACRFVFWRTIILSKITINHKFRIKYTNPANGILLCRQLHTMTNTYEELLNRFKRSCKQKLFNGIDSDQKWKQSYKMTHLMMMQSLT